MIDLNRLSNETAKKVTLGLINKRIDSVPASLLRLRVKGRPKVRNFK